MASLSHPQFSVPAPQGCWWPPSRGPSGRLGQASCHGHGVPLPKPSCFFLSAPSGLGSAVTPSESRSGPPAHSCPALSTRLCVVPSECLVITCSKHSSVGLRLRPGLRALPVRTKGWCHSTCVLGAVPPMAELLRKERRCPLSWASRAAGGKVGGQLASPLRPPSACWLPHWTLNRAWCGTGSLGLLTTWRKHGGRLASSRPFPMLEGGKSPRVAFGVLSLCSPPPPSRWALLHGQGPCCPGRLVHQVTWATR